MRPRLRDAGLGALCLVMGCTLRSGQDDVDVILHTDSPTLDTEAADSPAPDTEAAPDSDSDTEPPPPAPACQIGVGVAAFEPMPDPADLIVHRGPQGGWHVNASIQCVGTVATTEIDPRHPDQPVITLRLVDETGTFGGYEELPRPVRATETGHELLGEFVVVWTSTYEEAIDRAGTLELVVVDAVDAVYTDARQVRLVEEAPLP